MKINLKPEYLYIAAALLMSACSENDNPVISEAEKNQIVFRSSLPTLTARSAIVTTENLNSFYVSAFDTDEPLNIQPDGTQKTHFNHESVTLNSGGIVYTSPSCFWPEVGKESHQLSFFGFYPSLSDGDLSRLKNTSTATAFNYKFTDYRLSKDIDKHIDFIAAYTTGSMAENFFSGINLPFKHMMCRVEVKAWSAHKSCNIEIAGVRIGGVHKKADFNFAPDAQSPGYWSDRDDIGLVEYVFDNGDKIVTLNKGDKSTSTIDGALSIMGNTKPDGNNAMLIPNNYTDKWDFEGDINNSKNGMYLSVLLRIVDATSSETRGIQQYPYLDTKQGIDALDIPALYLAVKKQTNTVSRRLYKNKITGAYCTDEQCTKPYTLPSDEVVKSFGWAALPVTGIWAPGNIYTYTLDFSYGIGLHDPEVMTKHPKAGDPIISDIVGIKFTVKEWTTSPDDGFEMPGH